MMCRVDGPRTSDEGQLCRRYLPIARAYFLRRVGGEAGDDLAHEALIALIAALREGRVRELESVGGFLLGICKNLVRRRARDDERRERAFARLARPIVEEHEPQLDRQRLWTCFNALTARARDVLARSFVDDDDAPAIALALSMSEGNVRVVRHRALAALSSCLEGQS